MTLLIKYFLLTMLMVLCAVGYLMLDAYVKTNFAKWRDDLEQEGERIREFQNLNDQFYIQGLPDYSQPFSLSRSIRWTDLIHIVLIEIILMSWCFYFQLSKALQARKKLINVEVQSNSHQFNRKDSKVNLNFVIETTSKKKNNNQLFDKFWYNQREARLHAQTYEGLFVDKLNKVSF